MATKSSDWRPGPTVCRCCFAEGCYKDISTEYFWMGKREVYCEMLTETFDVTIAYSQAGGPNSNSRLICEPCISRLRDASDFKRQVVECEKTFMHHLDPGSSSVLEMDVHVEPADKEVVKLERVKLEAKLSDDDFDPGDDGGFPDDDDDDLDDEPLTKLASKVPKKESVDIMDLLDNSKAEKRKSTTKVKSSPAKKPKKKESPKPSASKQPAKAEKKKRGEELAFADNNTKKEDIEKPMKEKNLKVIDLEKVMYKKLMTRKRTSATALLQNTTLTPFVWYRSLYMCFYCKDQFTAFEHLKDHYDNHHNNINPISIGSAVWGLKGNIPVKVNIAGAKCRLCDEHFDNFDNLKAHVVKTHNLDIDMTNDGVIPYKIENDEYCCAVCNNSYAEFPALNRHLNDHFKSFICDQCGAGFATKLRWSSHCKSHENGGLFPCKACDKVFQKKATRKTHYTTAHTDHLNYRCTHCPERFKFYGQRKKHMILVHNIEVTEYKCDMCPKTFLMSGTMDAHKREVHMKIKRFGCQFCNGKFYQMNQLRKHMVRHKDTKDFECSICFKPYARKKSLEMHMRIHYNDKRYVCDICNVAFVQSSSLQRHIKVHNVEYTRSTLTAEIHPDEVIGHTIKDS